LQEGDLIGQVRGEIGADSKVLVIRRIEVTYDLAIAEELRETAERVHGFHQDKCPVARTISGCVEIETKLQFRG